MLLQTALVVLLTPSLAAGLIATERERGGWSLLRATPLSGWRIAMGKLTSVAWTLLLILAATVALVVPLSTAMAEYRRAPAGAGPKQSISEALGEAFSHRGYVLLCIAYTVCGFQLMFISVHFPAYLVDQRMTPETGMTALALIGLFNIFGSFAWGWLGTHYRKKNLLAILYFTRALAIEVGRAGITVNSVAPGWVQTASSEPEEIADGASNTPVGRPGTPEEMAAAVVFLASDEASYVTGISLVVDGGNIVQEYKGPPEAWY